MAGMGAVFVDVAVRVDRVFDERAARGECWVVTMGWADDPDAASQSGRNAHLGCTAGSRTMGFEPTRGGTGKLLRSATDRWNLLVHAECQRRPITLAVDADDVGDRL